MKHEGTQAAAGTPSASRKGSEAGRQAWPGRRLFLPIEWAAAAYCAITLIAMLCLWGQLAHPLSMLGMRALWVAVTLVAVWLHRLLPTRWMLFLRLAVQLMWLQQWYPDIYAFNSLANNLDHVMAGWDEALFGCQPALLFSQLVPNHYWCEAFNLGYVSYYPMILALMLVAYGKSDAMLKECSFVVLASFLVYYLIYLCLPVAGPQFYFAAVGTDQIAHGVFPELGTYFASHTDMLPNPGTDGLFRMLVEAAQASGERPQAAFPSSHIGVSTIVMLLCARHRLRLGLWLLPLWVLLCCATVYIQAHYVVDAVAGLLTAPLVFGLTLRAYPRRA